MGASVQKSPKMGLGVGTAADRKLEAAIKGVSLDISATPVSLSQRILNPFARCIQCMQLRIKPVQGDALTVQDRRSRRVSTTGKHGVGGEKTLVLDRYQNRDAGELGTLAWRRFIIDEEDTEISYWHDLPLVAGPKTIHAFIEIPKNTRAKYEMNAAELTNPIKQDEKKGKPRYYNVDIKWNYGALPQTWEQPEHHWAGLEGYAGDDDPVDIVDISGVSVPTGSVIVCKPLAALAMIDEGEVDWKVIVINVADPKAAKVTSAGAPAPQPREGGGDFTRTTNIAGMRSQCCLVFVGLADTHTPRIFSHPHSATVAGEHHGGC